MFDIWSNVKNVSMLPKKNKIGIEFEKIFFQEWKYGSDVLFCHSLVEEA